MPEEYENIFDEGTESTPSVEGSAEPKVDLAESDKTAESSSNADETVEGQESPAEAKETEEKTEVETEVDPLAEADKLLANPNLQKYAKNFIENVAKPRITELNDKIAQYEAFGTAEEVEKSLNLVKGLEAMRNGANGTPEATAEPFAKALYEQSPEKAELALIALAHLPSRERQGWTMLDEVVHSLGIDPTRMNEVREFVKNGYQLAPIIDKPEDFELEDIPSELHEAFSTFNADERADLLEKDVNYRNRILQSVQNDLAGNRQKRMDAERAETETAQRETAQREQFQKEWSEETQNVKRASDSNIIDGFVSSLVKNAGMDELDAMSIANMLNVALGDDSAAAQKTVAALDKAGVKFDAALSTLFDELNENARHIAFYQKTGDKTSYAQLVNKQADLERKISAKGNQIVAQLATRRQNAKIAPVQKQNAELTNAATPNGISPQNANPSSISLGNKVTTNFSDAAYAEDGIFAK